MQATILIVGDNAVGRDEAPRQVSIWCPVRIYTVLHPNSKKKPPGKASSSLNHSVTMATKVAVVFVSKGKKSHPCWEIPNSNLRLSIPCTVMLNPCRGQESWSAASGYQCKYLPASSTQICSPPTPNISRISEKTLRRSLHQTTR